MQGSDPHDTVCAMAADTAQEGDTALHKLCRTITPATDVKSLGFSIHLHSCGALVRNKAGQTPADVLAGNDHIGDKHRQHLMLLIKQAEEQQSHNELVLAAARGDVDQLTPNLSEITPICYKSFPNLPLPDGIQLGDTPLIAACRHNHKAVVSLLLPQYQKKELDFLCHTGERDHALTAASRTGNAAIISALLTAGFPVDKETNPHEFGSTTALIVATEHNHVEAVKTLLEADANPDLADERNVTALMLAVAYKHVDIIQLFVDKLRATKATQSNYSYTSWRPALNSASRNAHIAVVEILAANSSDDDLLEVIRELRQYPNVTAETYTTLAKRSNLQNVDEAWSAAINIDSIWPKSNSNFATGLIEAGVAKHVYADGRTTLMRICAEASDTACFKLAHQFIDHTPNLNHQDHLGNSALTLAARNGHTAIVKALLDRGVDPDPKHTTGDSVLMAKDITDKKSRAYILSARAPSRAIINHHRHMLKASSALVLLSGMTLYCTNRSLAVEHLTCSSYLHSARLHPIAATGWILASMILIASLVATAYFMPKARQNPYIIKLETVKTPTPKG